MSERKRTNNPARVIYLTMMWSRALVPVIALFAALASAVRTFQTTQEIYTAGGAGEGVAIAVSVALTVAVEGAIFGLAMARQWQEIKWRQARKKRYVVSLKTIVRSIQVRLGTVEPLTYDQMPDNANVITVVMLIAFAYALISNFNMGIRPLIEKIGGTSSIQSFLSSLTTAQASIQISFIVDSASMLFPPFMALAAGHLTARWASEIVTSMSRKEGAQERKQPAKNEAPAEQQVKGARERVLEYLAEHPEYLESGSQQKLAKQLRVSVGTVNNVYKELRSQNYSIERSNNGHGGTG